MRRDAMRRDAGRREATKEKDERATSAGHSSGLQLDESVHRERVEQVTGQQTDDRRGPQWKSTV